MKTTSIKTTALAFAAFGLTMLGAVATPALADHFHSDVRISVGDRGYGDRIFDRINVLRERVRREAREGDIYGRQARDFNLDLNDIDRDAREAMRWGGRDRFDRINFRLDRLSARLDAVAHGRGRDGYRDEGSRHHF